MAFWLRAGLVIGAIYYLSPLRLGEAPAPASPRPAHPPATLGEIAGPLLETLPAPLRARVVETAAAEAGRAVETGLRAAVAEAGWPTSRDTLTAHDRQPAWRGAAEREAR
ncbi:hypothetical protein [Methylobacterium platani]|uniref:Uncharacterized protein n=2 Tax=Methylobacterium platani TaxID=427683 RepID=A0A179S097_9HYPH|nr:hypothetical protein [Methylobacterium platani]KMO17338.1 hypothetical protein SQ03_12675 [Methylobacterium platani JCM 14648]OAS18334.1 hypothetical protein A5481_26615 [Methylobacterium platani]